MAIFYQKYTIPIPKKINLQFEFLIILLILTVKVSVSKEVTFYVPENHIKYSLIDSLYKVMDSMSLDVKELENRVIREDHVKGAKIAIKEKYFEHLLKYKISDTTKILTYCNTIKIYNEIREKYFNELLSAIDDNNRANCFLYLKHARNELSQINNIIYWYATHYEENLIVMEHNKKKQTLEIQVGKNLHIKYLLR